MKKGLLLIAAIIFIAFNTNAQIFSDNFQGNTPDTPANGWLTVSPNYGTNAYKWMVREYSGENYISAACWDGSNNNATEQWIVTPSFDATGVSSLSITFDNRGRFNPYQNIEVYVSTDFAGDSTSFTSATWTQVTGFTWDASYDDYDWVLATTAAASITGTANTYVAFKFVSTDAAGGNWIINNVVIDGSTSVSDISSTFSIYPNPATSVLNIQSEVNISNITVSNVIGQRVLNVNSINTDNYKLELNTLTNGVYLININNVDGTSAVAKFVKK